jgi:hypothetical protein
VDVAGIGVAAVDGTNVGVPHEAKIHAKSTPNVTHVTHFISVLLSC